MFFTDLPDNQIAILILYVFGRNFQQIKIIPEGLSLIEINPMFFPCFSLFAALLLSSN
jgi:hypothetical protein